MEEDYRTVQIFLGKDLTENGALEIAEVSICADSAVSLKCSCYAFDVLGYCYHTQTIEKRMQKNNGSFGLLVPENLPDEVAHLAFTTAESSREFILKYGKIEVF